MKKFNKFAAAAAAFALAVSSAGCSAPSAVTIGSGTKTALTIDGYEVPAGVFIYSELNAYSSAAYTIAMNNGMSSYPSTDEVKKARLENMEAADWIQNKATEDCADYVSVEKEFDKIGEQLTVDELSEVDDTFEQFKENELITKNGIGEDSLMSVIKNQYKQQHLFKHYYGIDSEYGCSEDELKQYFTDNTARVKYFTISLTDENGDALGADEQRDLENLASDYADEINSAASDEGKMAKFDEVQQEYADYQAAQTTTSEGETTVTTTVATTSAGETETTTTTDPYANEVTLVKATTTTTSAGETTAAVTSTTSAEQAASEKAQKDYNDYVFNTLGTYKAEVYKYDENTLYVIIKGDLSVRMTDDDLWSEDSVERLLSERYWNDFTDMMDKISSGYKIEKNKRAYRRYDPFKLTLEPEDTDSTQ